MKKIPYAQSLFIVVNIVLAILAYNGFFEGKDLLPILLGSLFVLIGAISLLINRKALTRRRIVQFGLILASSLAVIHLHFNVYSAQKVSDSRENSIATLQGNIAPELSYVQHFNLENNRSVSAYIKDHDYTILNFWATWCAPCLKEMPLLDDFYQKNQDHGIGLIGFTDYRARGGAEIELKKIREAVEKLKVSYPILIDSTTAVRSAYKADVLPATVLIDKKGRVLDYQIGIDGAKKIMQYVEVELEE